MYYFTSQRKGLKPGASIVFTIKGSYVLNLMSLTGLRIITQRYRSFTVIGESMFSNH